MCSIGTGRLFLLTSNDFAAVRYQYKIEFRNFFIIWILILLLGSTSITLGKSDICGNFPSSNGQYEVVVIAFNILPPITSHLCIQPPSAPAVADTQLLRNTNLLRRAR